MIDIPSIAGVPDDLIRAINDRLRRLSTGAPSSGAAGAGGTRVQRGDVYRAPDYGVGATYRESDTGLLYVAEHFQGEVQWVYAGGVWAADFADKPSDLGAADAGLLWSVADYAHVLRWNGSGWEAGPGEAGGGYVGFFDVAPGTGWKLMDGNGDGGTPIGAGDPIKVLKMDGTTRNITALASLAAAYIKGGAAFTGAVVAAVAPSVTVNSPATASTAVTAGGVSVAALAHTHGSSVTLSADPVSHMNMLPYIRK